jgi:hypothetical protein
MQAGWSMARVDSVQSMVAAAWQTQGQVGCMASVVGSG